MGSSGGANFLLGINNGVTRRVNSNGRTNTQQKVSLSVVAKQQQLELKLQLELSVVLMVATSVHMKDVKWF